MNIKRVMLLAGHYGSGKTNIAVNLAEKISEERKVALCDIDIVNPYFRSKDSEKRLREKGIEVVASQYANTNLDAPALPKEIYPALEDRKTVLIMDVGGDDRGALALGRYTPTILEENDYEMIFVANFYRPLTRNAEEAMEVMREIEFASKIPFTAIINNSNLGINTSAQTVLDTDEEIKKLSQLSGLPVIMTTVPERVYEEARSCIQNVFPLKLQEKII